MGKRKGKRKIKVVIIQHDVVDCSSGSSRVSIMSSDLGVAQGFASLQFVKKKVLI